MIVGERHRLGLGLVIACLVLISMHWLGLTPRVDRALFDQFTLVGGVDAQPAQVVVVTVPVVEPTPLRRLIEAAPGTKAWVVADEQIDSVPGGANIISYDSSLGCMQRPIDGIFRRANAACFKPLSGNPPVLRDSDALLDFSVGRGHIPILDLAQALESGWLAELADGRVVLLGPSVDPSAVAMLTPLDQPGDEGMSPAIYQAFALDALLSERTIGL